MHAARVSAGAVLKDDSRSSTSARLGRFSGGARRRGARGVLRTADCRGTHDQERRAAQERPDAVCDRARPHRQSRSARAAGTRIRRRASASSSSCCRSCRQCPAWKRRRCRTVCRRPATAPSPCRSKGKAYAQASDYPLAREGIVTPGYFATFQTKVLGGREFTTTDLAQRPARGDRERVVRARAFPRRRSGRPPDEADPARDEGAVADDRRRRAGPADGGHRQQQREPDRLLHPDLAERRRQRRSHRRAHARRRRRRSRRSSATPSRRWIRIWRSTTSCTMRHVIDRQTWFYTVFGTFFMAFGVLRALPGRRQGSTASCRSP